MKQMGIVTMAGLLVCLLFCCKSKKEHFVTLVNDRTHALNNHDTITLRKLYLTNATGESPNWGENQKSADQIIHQYARNFTSVADLTFNITHINTGEQFASVEMTMSGTMTTLEAEVPTYMKGKKYNLKICTLLEFEGDKIKREANYFDQVDFLRQMGFFEQNQK